MGSLDSYSRIGRDILVPMGSFTKSAGSIILIAYAVALSHCPSRLPTLPTRMGDEHHELPENRR